MSQYTSAAGPPTDTESDEQISAKVAEAVAAAEGVDPTQLDPLFYSVDPDRLDGLLESGRRSGGHAALEVEFQYHGYVVRVTPEGEVDLAEE